MGFFNHTKKMTKEEILNRLWHDYITKNPHAGEIYRSFTDEGETVVNDHIAFRTFNIPAAGIDVLAETFTRAGYVYRGDYHFEEKHLYAKHYEHEADKDAPRVFISELITDHFSPFLQETVRGISGKIPKGLPESGELVFAGNVWGRPSYERYLRLREESEYAAWVYVHGFCANHFTVSVNHLKKYDSLQKVNAFLRERGFLLNDSAGEIKGSPQELLEQSSTRAGLVEIDFSEGKQSIPACYYEFARRYPDENGNIFSGFIARSADKIFESTDFYKK